MAATPSTAARLAPFLRDLAIAWRARATYPPGHPSAVAGLAKANASLEQLLAETGPLELAASRTGLLIGEERLEGPTAARLSELLRRRGAAALELEPGAVGVELERFLDALAVDVRRARAADSFAAELAEAGLVHLRVRDLDFSEIALIDGDREPAAAEAGSLWDRLVRRVLAAGGIDGERLAARTAEGRTPAELLRLLLDGESPDRGGPGPPTRLTQALAALAAGYVEAPNAQVAAGIASIFREGSAVAQTALLRALAAALRPLAAAHPALPPLLAALPEEGAGRLRRALAETGAARGPAEPGLAADRDRLARLRRAFATADLDAFLDEPAPERSFEVLLELPEGATPPLSVAAAEIALELAPAVFERASALALLELAESSDLAVTRIPPLLSRLEAGYLQLVRSARLRQAQDLVERVQRRAFGAAPGAADFRRTAERMAGPETAEAVGAILPELPEEATQQVRSLVGRLGPAAVGGLVGLLAEAEDRAQRHRLLALLAGLGPLVVADATERLSDPRWYVVRNMLLLLRRVGDPGSVPAVRRCAEHPDLRVRLEAIRNLFAFDQSLPRALLRQALTHPDPRLAETAIELAGEHGMAEAVEPLTDLLRPWDPFGRRRSLRLKAIRALGVIADARALERLARFSRRWSWPPVAREERIALYRTLPAYPAEARRPWVESGRRSGVPEVRAIALRLAEVEEESA